jgi:hypothetical protein
MPEQNRPNTGSSKERQVPGQVQERDEQSQYKRPDQSSSQKSGQGIPEQDLEEEGKFTK